MHGSKPWERRNTAEQSQKNLNAAEQGSGNKLWPKPWGSTGRSFEGSRFWPKRCQSLAWPLIAISIENIPRHPGDRRDDGCRVLGRIKHIIVNRYGIVRIDKRPRFPWTSVNAAHSSPFLYSARSVVQPTTMNTENLNSLLKDVRDCHACAAYLPHGPRPIVQAGANARLLIIGQAPGARVHASGIPWDDLSGERLRDWMGIDKSAFYDPQQVAIIPMGFCYPGKSASGDLPPRRECAELWLDQLLASLPNIELTLLIGQYAQRHFLGKAAAGGVGTTVAAHAQFAPRMIPLPHPSPRNIAWFLRNPWFEAELLPNLRRQVSKALAKSNRESP